MLVPNPPLPPTECLKIAQARAIHLLDLPFELLEVVLQHITDIDTLFACRQTCRRMYGICDRNRAQYNTRVTLDALAKRDIEL